VCRRHRRGAERWRTSSPGWSRESPRSSGWREFGQIADFEAQQTVWEDDEHLLSVTTQGSVQAILRMTLDGAVERATETAPYEADSFDVAFAFAPRP
jgi:hypothetical protein